MTPGPRRVILMSARQFPPTKSRQCELPKCSCLQEMVTSASTTQMEKCTIAARVWKPLSSYCLDLKVAIGTSVCEMKSFRHRLGTVTPSPEPPKLADTEKSRIEDCTRHRCSTMRRIEGMDRSLFNVSIAPAASTSCGKPCCGLFGYRNKSLSERASNTGSPQSLKRSGSAQGPFFKLG